MSTATLSNDAVIRHLEVYQEELALKYKEGYANDMESFEKLNEMVIDWSDEEPGEFRCWYFEDQDIEVEVKKLFIRTFEKIKHERRFIPLELKWLSFDFICEGFDGYLNQYFPIDYNLIDALEEHFNFALDGFEGILNWRTYSDEIKQYILSNTNESYALLNETNDELDKLMMPLDEINDELNKLMMPLDEIA